MSDDATPSQFKLRFSPVINFGHIATVIAIIGSLLYGLSGYQRKIDNTVDGLADMKLSVAAHIAAMQLRIDKQFADVQISIANLPDVRAEVSQLSRRADEHDNRAAAQSNRMDELTRVEAQMMGQLQNLTRPPNKGN
jgi:hypothetical protein